MSINAVVRGCGGYLPKAVITNHDLEKTLDTSHSWIIERSGIAQRHIADQDELTSDLGAAAALAALSRAGIPSSEIDLIILATTTPDDIFPATAVVIQQKIGAHKAFAFDIQAVCSGFIYALSIANNFIKTGQAQKVLVIGAEVMSRILDWTDRRTCILFGDGAGAVVLEAQNNTQHGILSTHLYSDGRFRDLLFVDGGVGRQKTGVIQMQGREVFRHAVGKHEEAICKALETNDFQVSDLDWLIPHQANRRIIEAVAKQVKLPLEKIIMTIEDQANTSAASIPLAFSIAEKEGKLKPGHLVAAAAIGGGFTWGSVLLRW